MIKINKLKQRIKKHEGFSNKLYYDQLGNATIGYGHIIKPNENFLKNKKFGKKYLNEIFNKDFSIAKNSYLKLFKQYKLPQNIIDVIIEMIFQLGEKRFLKFKKMIRAIKKKDFETVSCEMIDSLWYKQTPKRVKKLVKIIRKESEKK